MTNIVLGGNSLQTTSIITQEGDHYSVTKDVKFFPLANANGGVMPYDNYPTRVIPLSGTLNGGSIAATDALIDTFVSYLYGLNKTLDIDYNGSTRRFVGAITRQSVKRPGGLGYAKFDIEFTCTDAFGRDTTTTTAINQTGRTLGSYNDAYTFLGSAPFQLPVATITLSAVTGGTAQTIQWGNANNGQAIIVTRTWAASDVLVIDCVAKTVKVNGVEVAFSGAFPEFPPGAQILQYSDGFTTRTVAINVGYVVRYG